MVQAMKPLVYGTLEFCRSLGLSSLSWAYYHAVGSVRRLIDEQMEKTSFLAILTSLASVYYGITDIDWDEPNVNKWLEYMGQISKKEMVESEMNGGEQPVNCLIALSSLCNSFINKGPEPTLCI